jgi:hypothetical protein
MSIFEALQIPETHPQVWSTKRALARLGRSWAPSGQALDQRIHWWHLPNVKAETEVVCQS